MDFYCYSKWSTCKKALKFLEGNKIEYNYFEIGDNPPSYEDIKEIVTKVDINKLFNVRGKVYKDLNLKEKIDILSKEEKIELLSSNGMLVKRPLLIDNNKVIIGFNEEEYIDLVVK